MKFIATLCTVIGLLFTLVGYEQGYENLLATIQTKYVSFQSLDSGGHQINTTLAGNWAIYALIVTCFFVRSAYSNWSLKRRLGR